MRGLGSPCYARQIRNWRYFAGLRLRVLILDRSACPVCGRQDCGKRIHVHHRRPEVSQAKFLITVCPSDHAMVHCLEVVDRILPALLLELWREEHCEASERLALDFERARHSGPIHFHQFWEIAGRARLP